MSKTSISSRAGKAILRRKGSADQRQTIVSASGQHDSTIDAAARRATIAEAAYYRAERRGFAPGFEMQDWLLAENELDAQGHTQIQRRTLEKLTSSSAEFH